MKEKYKLGFLAIGIALVFHIITVLFFNEKITPLHSLLLLGAYITGNYLLAKAKGYPPIFAGLGLLGFVGSFLIIVLPDKNSSK